VRDRLATIAQAVADATRAQNQANLERLASEAQDILADAFLDPLVPQLLNSPGFADVLGSGDRLATSIQLALANISPIGRPSADEPEQILHYRVVRHLAPGGMGSITLAWDEHLDRYVVLKQALHEAAEQSNRRLEREARASARLRHPNIVTIYSLEYVRELPLLIEEYIDGVDLTERIGALSPEDATSIAAQIAAGLQCAHDLGIIHRDLKPQNVRLRRDGTPVILDFGLGKAFLASPEDHTQLALTAEGTMLGTPSYMAPEQLKGTAVTAAADVFAFGVLFYEILTGKRPFTGTTRPELFAAILAKEPPPITAPASEGIAELIMACLSKDTARRPEIATIVDQLAPRSIRPPTTTPRATSRHVTIVKNQDDGWAANHREVGRAILERNAPTFECFLSFTSAKPQLTIAGMKGLFDRLPRAHPTSLIGKTSDDERYKLRRGSDDVFVTIARSGERAHWAAHHNGSFFYLTDLPLLEGGLLAIEPLMGETFRSLQYLSAYALAIARDDAQLTVEINIHNATGHTLASSDWSHPFGAALDTLHKRAEGDVRSTLEATAGHLLANLRVAGQVLFDDLMTYFDFLSIPESYYTYTLQAMLGENTRVIPDLNVT